MTPPTELLNINPIENERPSQKLTYHHARPIEAVSFGQVIQRPRLEIGDDIETAEYHHRAYKWLESKLGFYPLFLAVGRTNDHVRMTGYQNQWMQLTGWGKDYREYRQKGTYPNKVLFSYKERPPSGVFVDYSGWHLVLMNSDQPEELEKYYHTIFRPSWNQYDWITCANKSPDSVQMVVPSLDLRSASQVTVRNIETQIALEKMGFNNVKVARLTLNRPFKP